MTSTHRATYAKTGAGWTAACTCGTDCELTYDRLLYPTWDAALNAARANLAAAQHDTRAGQETS